jgi:hypothetical protein
MFYSYYVVTNFRSRYGFRTGEQKKENRSVDKHLKKKYFSNFSG